MHVCCDDPHPSVVGATPNMPIKSAIAKPSWKPSGTNKEKAPLLLSSFGIVGKKLATPPRKTTNFSLLLAESPRRAALPQIQIPMPLLTTPPIPAPTPLASPQEFVPTPRTPMPEEPAAESIPIPITIPEPIIIIIPDTLLLPLLPIPTEPTSPQAESPPTPSTSSETEQERLPSPERPPSPVRDGLVIIKYADLMARLSIESGHLSVDLIDDELALRAVYPRCDIELSRIQPIGVDMKTADWDRLEARDTYGVFFGLEAGVTYFVVIREHPEEIEKDEMRRQVLRAESEAELDRRRIAAESTD